MSDKRPSPAKLDAYSQALREQSDALHDRLHPLWLCTPEHSLLDQNTPFTGVKLAALRKDPASRSFTYSPITVTKEELEREPRVRYQPIKYPPPSALLDFIIGVDYPDPVAVGGAAPVPPPPKLYDGLAAEQCLERYQRYQREDLSMLVRKAPNCWDIDLTPAQLAAARELWSAALRAKVDATRAADAERERNRVLVDLEDL